MVDYSVRVSHLDKNGIEAGLMGYLVDLGQEKERLRKALAKKLKEKHPIHNKLDSFTNAKLNEIFDVSLCPAQRWLAVIFSILGKRSIRDWENNCGADC